MKPQERISEELFEYAYENRDSLPRHVQNNLIHQAMSLIGINGRKPNKLSRIESDTKHAEIMKILAKDNPPHQERQYLVGFLRYVGYSREDVKDIIHTFNRWSDYDQHKTAYFVDGIFDYHERKVSS